MYLVIVESPAKAKTIERILGSPYRVVACYGHVRDLVPKKGAIDIDNGFILHYQNSDKHSKHLNVIKQLLKKSEKLVLATDPDREGEAIAWNLLEIFRDEKFMKSVDVERVTFNQITPAAVKGAIASPKSINMDLVHAQQARRALDYLVGFNLSPLLWKKVQRGLSAGRVQSPALRLLIEREDEIRAFVTQEYWSVHATINNPEKVAIQLTHFQGEKLEKFSITTEQHAHDTTSALEKDKSLIIEKIKKQQRHRKPPAPLITSTLQQESSKRLGYSATKTMRLAQTLYEGLDVDDKHIALITYMRTDSTHLAPEAETEIRNMIKDVYGNEYLPEKPRRYTTKAKNAQEAHEAIRPVDIRHTPDSVRDILSQELWRLYKLIWERTMSSQMTDAKLETQTVFFISNPESQWKCSGSKLVFDGYLRSHIDFEYSDYQWPDFHEGQQLQIDHIKADQHFTEPPPRYNEASLIKTLEEHGIGRPSTYASIITTLTKREYAHLENKRFHPTDTGEIVSKFLVSHFDTYVDYEFTAKLEDSLDHISLGKEEYIQLLSKFWKPFNDQIHRIEETVKRSDVTSEKLDEKCPECSHQLLKRLGRSGFFVGCSNYPECKFTKSLGEEQGETAPPVELTSCPKCNNGSIISKKSRRGKVFYACNQYPNCKYALWNKPLGTSCPSCSWPILMEKITKRYGTQHICPECEHTIAIDDNDKTSDS